MSESGERREPAKSSAGAEAKVKPSFFTELKRRHMVRPAIVYVAAVWALAQGIAQLGPTFGVSSMVTWWFVIACAIGFPFWLVFAWYFKFTPHGIARESEVEEAAVVRRGRHRIDYWIIGILAAAVVLLLTNQLILQRGKTFREFTVTTAPSAATAIPAKSIAVLPFANLSADKSNEYFVAGIQDLILTKLADIGGLKVIARTSTAKYASHPGNLTEIGRQLGVATILEGSVQKAGSEVLINVQLINTKTDSHIWAQAYTRTLDNIFGVEGEVATMIAAALKAELSPAEAARVARKPTRNPRAYNFYLRAKYEMTQGAAQASIVRLTTALPLFRQAVAADPGFALAWANLSVAETIIARNGGGGLSVPKLRAAAREDAARAQKLAPHAAPTQVALGFVALYGDGDSAAALKAFRAALAARPNDAGAMASIGFALNDQHRYGAAIAQFKRAVALDPSNANFELILALTCLRTRRYDEALAPLRRALALNPASPAYRSLYSSAILYAGGGLARALAAAQGEAPLLKLSRVSLLTLERKYAAAIALLRSIPDTPEDFGLFSFSKSSKTLQLADLYRAAGDAARAKPLYEKARKQIQTQLKAQAGNTSHLALVWLNLAKAQFGLGERQAALTAIAKSLKLAAGLKSSIPKLDVQADVASLYAQAGRPDLAVPLLAKLLAATDGGAVMPPVLLRLDPSYDPIRHDPRFQALLKQYPLPVPATLVVGMPTSTTL